MIKEKSTLNSFTVFFLSCLDLDLPLHVCLLLPSGCSYDFSNLRLSRLAGLAQAREAVHTLNYEDQSEIRIKAELAALESRLMSQKQTRH
jgi:hypothetical protein